MNAKDFLGLVVPDDGYYIVATPNKVHGRGWWNYVASDTAELIVKARSWEGEQRDVYIALASYSEKEVWNPTKQGWTDGKKNETLGAYEKRTQGNAKSLKALFLDLDVGPDKPEKKYPTQRDAIQALRKFCAELNLPKPLVVNSGYGIHVYWPFDAAVPRDAWQVAADNLKSAATAFRLKQDPNVTADSARVLRLPTTKNFKHNTEVPVEALNEDPAITPFAQLAALLNRYVTHNNIPVTATKAPTLAGGPPTLPAGVASNLGATDDPLNGNMLVYGCAAMRQLVANRGATATEPQWRAGLALARFCEPADDMMLAVSDGYPKFTITEMRAKVANMTAGPTKCTTFWHEDNATCEACPHWTNITSPAEIAREHRLTPPKEINVAPPYPYMRVNGMVIWREKGDDDETTVDHVVCAYDLYPKRILEQLDDDTEADERSVWVAVLPRKGPHTFKLPQSLLSDPRKLHAYLLSRGLYIKPKEIKSVQTYMTAYLHELAKAVDRERMFDRLGWHDNHTAFVLPSVVYHRDGSEQPHVTSKAIEAITKNAIHTQGSLQGWLDALQFYGGPIYVPQRWFGNFTWGSPLLHMTTQKGVLIAASGDTGQGKTTTLEMCASIVGDPTGLLVGGGRYGATINATWEVLGRMHSLPMFWDDTTERDPEEIREFLLHISTGRGKERMHGNTHDGRVVTWETMVISSANTDDVSRIMSTGKDSDPHLMRFISVPFNAIDTGTEAKLRADAFKFAIRKNFGWGMAGYLPMIVKHYQKVQVMVEKNMERFDRLLQATSGERHWSATLACGYVGGRIAHELGLWPFNPADDEQWALDHMDFMRDSYQQAANTSADILNQFLEEHVSNTLILSAKQSSHVDNIVNRPHGPLFIRHEVDNDRIYVARNAINDWCTEKKANRNKLEAELVMAGVIIDRQKHKVLGADTPYAMGQTRCWEIDRKVLSQLRRK